tara:strand:- start:2593 stop:3903 length:1311 start_codon:yes stop_codon:yes gene_type:complete
MASYQSSFATPMRFEEYVLSFERVIEDPSYAASKHLTVSPSSEGDLFIIKYDREKLTSENAHTLGLFRSVIVIKEDGQYRVVFAAQPKSVSFEQLGFQEDDATKEKPLYIESIIEGTMINFFHDGQKWRIATRSCIGANSKFYHDDEKDMSFRAMFMEAFKKQKLKLSYFRNDLGYSFVLQHPKNRIVSPVSESHIYLVNIFASKETTGTEHLIYNQIGQDDHLASLIEKGFFSGEITLTSAFSTVTKLEDGMEDLLKRKQELKEGAWDWKYKGVFIRNLDGKHAKLINANYEYVANLVDNQPKTQFRYYHLLERSYSNEVNMLEEYLQYFPEDRYKFVHKYEPQFEEWINELLKQYNAWWHSPMRAPAQYKTCIAKMADILEIKENVYREGVEGGGEEGEILQKSKGITRCQFRKKVIKTLEPRLIMHSINFDYN